MKKLIHIRVVRDEIEDLSAYDDEIVTYSGIAITWWKFRIVLSTR